MQISTFKDPFKICIMVNKLNNPIKISGREGGEFFSLKMTLPCSSLQLGSNKSSFLGPLILSNQLRGVYVFVLSPFKSSIVRQPFSLLWVPSVHVLFFFFCCSRPFFLLSSRLSLLVTFFFQWCYWAWREFSWLVRRQLCWLYQDGILIERIRCKLSVATGFFRSFQLVEMLEHQLYWCWNKLTGVVWFVSTLIASQFYGIPGVNEGQIEGVWRVWGSSCIQSICLHYPNIFTIDWKK